jgi:aspartokinase
MQIWKEVDGIFTADPRKVSTARLIPIISPDEAAELTYYGSEVVHPFSMEQVRLFSAVTFTTADSRTIPIGHREENSHQDQKR